MGLLLAAALLKGLKEGVVVKWRTTSVAAVEVALRADEGLRPKDEVLQGQGAH